MKDEKIIAHYGVKGMRWGVRNEDKEIANARYRSRQQKSNEEYSKIRKSNISRFEEKDFARYKKQGMTTKDARLRARKSRNMKAALIVAGVAGVTLASIRAKKIMNYKYVDSLVKAGTKMQNLNTHNPKVMGERVFATLGRADKVAYKGLYGPTLKLSSKGKTVYNTTLSATKDIPIASEKSAVNIMRKLSASNADYSKILLNDIRKYNGPKTLKTKLLLERAKLDLKRGKITSSVYRAQNVVLTGTKSSDKSASMFQKAVEKSGYGGVRDVHDMIYSPMKANSPTILFGKNQVAVSSSKKVSGIEMASSAVPTVVGKYGAYPVAGVGAVTGTGEISDRLAIDAYRKQHPKTRLNNNQILRTLGR